MSETLNAKAGGEFAGAHGSATVENKCDWVLTDTRISDRLAPSRGNTPSEKLKTK